MLRISHLTVDHRQVQIVGDDLLVTNPKRIGKAVEDGDACNALLLKASLVVKNPLGSKQWTYQLSRGEHVQSDFP